MWQIIGHEQAVALLQQSLAAGRLAHAYLFTGPPQIGKTTLALELAKAVNCPSQDPPCGTCRSCQHVAQGLHPDVRMIEADQGTIKIEQIRALQREAVLSPYEGAWRVYIIQDFQQATLEAANCLLKTLEEPPPQVLLVLTATDAGALLPTIVSRCQILSLRPLPRRRVAEALVERYDIPPEQADLLSCLSEGRIGWAIQAWHDKQILEKRLGHLRALHALPGESLVRRISYAQQLGQQAENLPMILDLWLSWWRDLLLIKACCQDLVTNRDHLSVLEGDARRYELANIYDFIRAIRRTKSELEGNANPRLATEVLLMTCPSPTT